MEPPNQGLLVTKWKIPFRQVYVCHRDLDNLNGIDSQLHPHVLSQKLLRTQHKKQRVPRVRPRKCLLCQNTRVHTLNCGFILRKLQFSAQSFLYYCLSFFLFSFVHCIVCSSIYRLPCSTFNLFIRQLQEQIYRSCPLPPRLLVTTYVINCL